MKKLTKKNYTILLQHYNSEFTCLDECYGKYSDAKQMAIANCLRAYYKDDGIYGRIISYNSCFFTFGYYYFNLEVGKWYFKYFTHTKTITFEADETFSNLFVIKKV